MLKTARTYFLSALLFLVSSSKMPPLNRKAFLREAVLVFAVRGGLLWLLGSVWQSYETEVDQRTSIGWILAILTVLFFGCYLVSYFRVMHRRLLYLNFPFPRGYCISVAVCMTLIPPLCYPAYAHSMMHNIPFMVLEYGSYLVLLPWGGRVGQGKGADGLTTSAHEQ